MGGLCRFVNLIGICWFAPVSALDGSDILNTIELLVVAVKSSITCWKGTLCASLLALLLSYFAYQAGVHDFLASRPSKPSPSRGDTSKGKGKGKGKPTTPEPTTAPDEEYASTSGACLGCIFCMLLFFPIVAVFTYKCHWCSPLAAGDFTGVNDAMMFSELVSTTFFAFVVVNSLRSCCTREQPADEWNNIYRPPRRQQQEEDECWCVWWSLALVIVAFIMAVELIFLSNGATAMINLAMVLACILWRSCALQTYARECTLVDQSDKAFEPLLA